VRNFELDHGDNKLQCYDNDDDVNFALDKHA